MAWWPHPNNHEEPMKGMMAGLPAGDMCGGHRESTSLENEGTVCYDKLEVKF
jgi:hypothetical protein